MPLSRELLRKVQALLSRACRGLSNGHAAAEEETAAMLSARWASNASASTSMTFASSSSIPSSVRASPSTVASLSRYDQDDHVDPLRRGREIYSIAGGGIAHGRSFFTRTPLLPAAVAAVAAGSGERNGKKRNGSSSKERRRSSSSSSTSTSSTPKRRILPSEMPRLPPLPRGGQRQWRTLLEDEVRIKRGFFFPDAFLLLLALFQTSSSAAHLFPLLPNATREKIKHPLREEDIPLEIRAIMNRLREAGEFGFALIFLRKTSK